LANSIILFLSDHTDTLPTDDLCTLCGIDSVEETEKFYLHVLQAKLKIHFQIPITFTRILSVQLDTAGNMELVEL